MLIRKVEVANYYARGQPNVSNGFIKYIPFQQFIPFDLNNVIDDQASPESKSGQVENKGESLKISSNYNLRSKIGFQMKVVPPLQPVDIL